MKIPERLILVALVGNDGEHITRDVLEDVRAALLLRERLEELPDAEVVLELYARPTPADGGRDARVDLLVQAADELRALARERREELEDLRGKVGALLSELAPLVGERAAVAAGLLEELSELAGEVPEREADVVERRLRERVADLEAQVLELRAAPGAEE